MPKSVLFFGEKYKIAERVGLMPLMRFAKVAKAGVDSLDIEGMTVLHDLLEQCIDPEHWQRFQDAATKLRADGDDLLAVVKDVFEALSARPTSRPSDSSDGPSTTEERSTADSSSRVVRRLEKKGRPDLAQIVTQAQEARTA